jgi:hypothetical protein
VPFEETDLDLDAQALTEGLVAAPPHTNGHRTPPHDDQTEAAIIGAALITTTAHQAAGDAGLAPHHFYRPRHRHLWAAIDATGADHTLTVAWLTDQGLLDDIGGPSTITQLLADAPGTLRAGEWATRIVHLHRLRQALAEATEIQAAVYDGDGDRVAQAIRRLTEQTPVVEQPTSGSLIDWSTVFDRSLDSDWLLEPVIASGRGHALYAGQKAGKSLFVASVLVPAALGHPVLERRCNTPLRTLYLDFEMTREDVAERVEAMGFGPGNAANLEPLAYHVLPAIPPLDTAAGGAAVLAWARDHQADLVVFDTMARAVAGPENEADTYRDYYRHTGSLLKAAGIATLRLDHSGKEQDRGQRGSSAKADDVDVVWRLKPRENDQFTLECTHRRMGWVPQKVELVRLSDPLKYLQVTHTWPAGTKEAAQSLDELGAPLEITHRAARALLREAGRTAGSEALLAALRYRRDTHGTDGGTRHQAVLDPESRNGR